MALTVSSSLNTTWAGEIITNWSGEPLTQNSDIVKYGSYSLAMTKVSQETVLSKFDYYTQNSSTYIDCSTHQHFLVWVNVANAAGLDTKVLGGIGIYLEDSGGNYVYFYVGGKDNYSGGWRCFIVHSGETPDSSSGTMTWSQIRYVGIRIKMLAKTTANAANVWIDIGRYGNYGLTVTGGGLGTEGDWSEVLSGDESSAYGIIRSEGGVYFLQGPVIFGDASGTGNVYFEDASQIVIFEDTPVSSTFYDISVVGNGTGTTNFVMGTASGTSGIQGCILKSSGSVKCTITAIDTDIDLLGFYGCVFIDMGQISLPVYSTTRKMLSCSFDQCGMVVASTCTITNCLFTSSDDVGLQIASTSHNATECSFINCINAVKITVAGTTYSFSGMNFSGGDGSTYYDIENSVNATVTDSYAESNQDTDQTIGNGTINRGAESFTGDGNVLSRARIWLKKLGTLTGTIVAKVYAATGSAPNAYPTGAALATSETIPATDIGTTYAVHDFEFEDEFTLVNTTEYFISIEYSGGTSDYLVWGTDSSSPPVGSNFATYTTSWSAVSTNDGCFYIYTGGIVKISLGSGSNPTYDNNSGTPPGATIMPISNTLTLTDLVATSEVRILDTSDNILGGIESSGTTFAYNYVYVPATTIRIVVAHNSYKFIRFEYVLTDSDQNLPIQQQTDVNYSNP